MGARQFKVVLVGGHHVASCALLPSATQAARDWVDRGYPTVIRQDTGHSIEIRPGTPPTIIPAPHRTPPEWLNQAATLLNATINQADPAGAQ